MAVMARIRPRLRSGGESNDRLIYQALLLLAVLFPFIANNLLTSGNGSALIGQAGDAGVYVLLALGLNVVVGFAGLLDLGYAAFFAIGAYTYGILASGQLLGSPLHHAIHFPFWPMLVVALLTAALFGIILGAPTLRLRGDYLAIVTLGFGEIVPRVFKNLSQWTGGVNGVGPVDQPTLYVWINGPWVGLPFGVIRDFNFGLDPLAYYVVMVILLVIAVIAVTNLYRSRLGRAWMAIREDEVAAAAMGVNPVLTKLMAFSIGASFSGLAGAYYAAKLSLVSPENFAFVVSVTILVMVVLGGMGNPPGVIVGAILLYYVLFRFLGDLPDYATNAANAVGLGVLNAQHGDWSGLHDEVQRLNFLIYGIILVSVMLLRPQGLIPSHIRRAELKEGVTADSMGGVGEAASGGTE
jgi:ABC-type branched-subunit amino acid transport system permease subunit